MRKVLSRGICLLLLACTAAAVPATYAAADTAPQPSASLAAATAGCGWVPDDVSGSITPQCGQQNTQFTVEVQGFDAKEYFGYWLDGDYGIITSTSRPAKMDVEGKFELSFYPYKLTLKPGLYFWVFKGTHSLHQAIVYFRVTAEGTPTGPNGPLPAAVNGSITPSAGGWYTEFTLAIWNFLPNEPIDYYLDGDHGVIVSTKQTHANSQGGAEMTFHTYDNALEAGQYFWVFRGERSGRQAIVYFWVSEEVATPDQSCGKIAASQHGKISPWCGGQDTAFAMDVWGFLPYEPVGYWLTGPQGVVFGTTVAPPITATGSEEVTFKASDYGLKPGLYFWVFQGVNSGHQSIVYFRVR